MKTCLECQTRTCESCNNAPPDLLEENEDALELFLNCITQWRAVSLGVIGLDYPAVESVAGTLGVDYTPVLFQKIRALEFEVLSKENQKAASKPCSNKLICSMCRKTNCRARVTDVKHS